jgi:hypothetical protein
VSEKKAKKRLNKAEKVIVVKCLARFMTPTEVSELLLEDFNIDFTRQAVEKYDPTKLAGQDLSEELKAAFDEERKKFAAELENIDVAHQSFRLMELSKLYRQAKGDGKDVIAAQHLEQAAKERGGYFTNKREHSGPNGGAIPIDVGDKKKVLTSQMLKKLMAKGMSEEEARATLISMGVNELDISTISGS